MHHKSHQQEEVLMLRWVSLHFASSLVGGLIILTVAASSSAGQRRPTGSPQLVSVEPLEMCEPFASGTPLSLMAALQQEPSSERTSARPSLTLERAPLRTIRDSFPTYSAV